MESRVNPESKEKSVEGPASVKQHKPSRPRVMVKAEAVWDYMERLSLSQNDLAKEVGLSRSFLSQMVNGRRSPSPKTRRGLLEALGSLEFDDIFYIEGPDEE